MLHEGIAFECVKCEYKTILKEIYKRMYKLFMKEIYLNVNSVSTRLLIKEV